MNEVALTVALSVALAYDAQVLGVQNSNQIPHYNYVVRDVNYGIRIFFCSVQLKFSIMGVYNAVITFTVLCTE